MFKPISYEACWGAEVSTIFSKSKLVVPSISMPEEGVAISCKLNGLANNYNVLCLLKIIAFFLCSLCGMLKLCGDKLTVFWVC